jgi:hypothetical protein
MAADNSFGIIISGKDIDEERGLYSGDRLGATLQQYQPIYEKGQGKKFQ